MSDTNFMNTYVNLVVETVHNYLNEVLQLKTQVTILNGLVSEKDQAIASLSEQVESLKVEKQQYQGNESEMQKLRDNAASWETQYNNMINKVSHMDTLTNQYNDLKRQFVEKTQDIDNITNELNSTKQVVTNRESECNSLRQNIDSLTSELESVKKKLEKVTKKEEKKPVVSPKKEINKEMTKPSSTPVSPFVVKVEETKEIDDDF